MKKVRDTLKFYYHAPAYEQRARKIADKRENTHGGDPSSRPLSEDYELKGVVGELAMEYYCGLPIDEEIRKRGDKGIDFVYRDKIDGMQRSVDVKASAKPPSWLPLEEKRVLAGKYADILVMAQVSMSDKVVYLLGWEWAHELIALNYIRCLGKYNIPSYVKAVTELQPMQVLLDRMDRAASLRLYGRARNG